MTISYDYHISTQSHTLLYFIFIKTSSYKKKHFKKKTVVPTVGIILYNSKKWWGKETGIGGMETTMDVIFLNVGLFAFLFFFLQFRSEYVSSPILWYYAQTAHNK